MRVLDFFPIETNFNNFIEQSPHWEADSRLARRFSRPFCNGISIRIYRPRVKSILSQFNILKHVTSYFQRVILILFSRINLRLLSGIFSLRCLPRILASLSVLRVSPTDFIFVAIILVKQYRFWSFLLIWTSDAK